MQTETSLDSNVRNDTEKFSVGGHTEEMQGLVFALVVILCSPALLVSLIGKGINRCMPKRLVPFTWAEIYFGTKNLRG